MTSAVPSIAVASTVAIDGHAHVFSRQLQLAPSRRYTSGYDATPEQYLALLDQSGLSHGVLVQPSFLGTDNRYLIAALVKYPDRLRGVAVIDEHCDPHLLDQMDSVGVCGIRLNIVGGAAQPDFSDASWRELARHLRRLGWSVEIHTESARLGQLLTPLLDHGLTVVVDHMGRIDPVAGIDDPGFRVLLDSASSGQVSVKISGLYRNGDLQRNTTVATAALPLLQASFGNQHLLWGSDWPHTQFESIADFPQTLATLRQLVADDAVCATLLCDASRRLYRI